MRNEPLVFLGEIDQHLSISWDTIYPWIDDKGLPAHKVGRLWKFKMSKVGKWVRSS